MMTPVKPAPAPQSSDSLARQPILNKDEKVLGYELLYREGILDERSSAQDGGTRSVIDTLNVMGLDVICDGRWAFLQCTRDMLLKELFLLLPSDRVVLEIPDTMAVDDAVVAACEQLKIEGYRMALDNFVLDDSRSALIPSADYLKINIVRVPQEHCTQIHAQYAAKSTLIANKVETRIQFLTALKDGFTLFQGYFFHHPERMRARHIPANKASQLRLLKAISATVLDLDEVEGLIKQDASLCYRLLRYLNSPLLGVSATVNSVRHGMRLLGERELIRWIRMATTLIMGEEKCSDLVLSSLVRARFCELIAPKIEHGACDLFLIGMFSLMDAILEVPMGVVVEGLAFDAETREELLGLKTGHPTKLTPLFELMLAREAGEWDVVARHAKKLNLSLPFVNRAFNEAVGWAHQMTSSGSSEKPA